MKPIRLLPLLALCALFAGCQSEAPREAYSFSPIPFEYPSSLRDTSVADYYGELRVGDPYRWLESVNSPEAQAWVKEQRAATDNYLGQLPGRNYLRSRLSQLWDYERLSAPWKAGDYYYYFKNKGLQAQPVLYRVPALDGQEETVLDPNGFSADGTVALGELSIDKEGKFLAFQVSEAGSDWQSILIKDLQSGKMLRDTLRWVKFSEIAWQGEGFFYSRYPAPDEGEAYQARNEFHQVYYHRPGQPQSEDELIFADRNAPMRNAYAHITQDEQYLLLSLMEGTDGNALYFRRIGDVEPGFTPLTDAFDYEFELVGSTGDSLFLRTNYRAPKGRLIRVDAKQPAPDYWAEVLPESEDILQEVKMVDGQFLAHYLHKASSALALYGQDGSLIKRLSLPGMGTVTAIKGRQDSPEAFLTYTQFLSPETVYRLDLEAETLLPYHAPEIPFDASRYEVKQVTYSSYDGTEVPMFIIHRKGLKLNGNNPALLYGYGGFNVPITPIFNRTRQMLFPIILEQGGVCAVPNIRGGGEFGADWHKGGIQQNKQNVFDDFQAAAEYLIEQGYTSPKKLAIHGASNGGLLVGACLTQRPELYGVALPAVGVLDMLRYHQFTIGWAWADDYGRADDPTSFDYLYAYSPLHNLAQEAYPATLITTADHDDRVVPAHSYKFAAAMQHYQRGDTPVLIRIEGAAGHGAGQPVSKRIESGADMLAFLFYNLQVPVEELPEQ